MWYASCWIQIILFNTFKRCTLHFRLWEWNTWLRVEHVWDGLCSLKHILIAVFFAIRVPWQNIPQKSTFRQKVSIEEIFIITSMLGSAYHGLSPVSTTRWTDIFQSVTDTSSFSFGFQGVTWLHCFRAEMKHNITVGTHDEIELVTSCQLRSRQGKEREA